MRECVGHAQRVGEGGQQPNQGYEGSRRSGLLLYYMHAEGKQHETKRECRHSGASW